MLKAQRAEKFRFPNPVPMPDVKKFLVNNVQQKDGLSKCNADVLEHLKSKAAGMKGYVFMDLMSSAKFSSVSEGKCHCITRACLGLYYFLGQNLLTASNVMLLKNTVCYLQGEESKVASGSTISSAGPTFTSWLPFKVGPRVGQMIFYRRLLLLLLEEH